MTQSGGPNEMVEIPVAMTDSGGKFGLKTAMPPASSTDRLLLSLDLPPLTVAQFQETLVQWARQSGRPRLVTYLNAHNVNLAFEDAGYASVLPRCDLLYADGMGVVWGWRRLGREVPERVNAGDFIVEFCRRLADEGISLYLLGSYPGVADDAAAAWMAQSPALRIAGTHDGFFSEADEPALAEGIRKAAPAILLVGMGVPRQEQWAARWKVELGVPVVWCVGALFEYWGMKRSRAPVWMRRLGLEWVWRLALEPRRMWRRYLVGNLRFVRHIRRLRRIE